MVTGGVHPVGPDSDPDLADPHVDHPHPPVVSGLFAEVETQFRT
jgi:hypothetical protein